MTGIVSAAPGGLSTLCGGTRTAVKTVRPWQVRLTLPENSADCMLCTRQQLDEHFPADGWKTFANSNTPWNYHRLLIPTECWPIDKLWSLGGPETLATMLRLAIGDVIRTRGHLFPMWIYTHVGYGAGQNFSHHHWHICEPPVEPQKLDTGPLVRLWDDSTMDTFLGDDTCFVTSLGGVRAGQAFIIPTKRTQSKGPLGMISHLSAASHRLIETFNDRFKQPDYCLFFAFHSETEWYARYTPILNNWGGSEFAALDHGTPFVLPWPHEATAAHLRGES